MFTSQHRGLLPRSTVRVFRCAVQRKKLECRKWQGLRAICDRYTSYTADTHGHACREALYTTLRIYNTALHIRYTTLYTPSLCAEMDCPHGHTLTHGRTDGQFAIVVPLCDHRHAVPARYSIPLSLLQNCTLQTGARRHTGSLIATSYHGHCRALTHPGVLARPLPHERTRPPPKAPPVGHITAIT